MRKGVSLVSLIIVIIVIVILAGIVAISGADIFHATNINTFAIEILNIQTAVDEYYFRHGEYPVTTTVTYNVSNINTGSLSQFSEETVVNNSISLKLVNLSLIGIDETEFGNNEVQNDVYALSVTSGKVYYLAGVEYEGSVYYTITDEIYTAAEVTNVNNSSTLSPNDIKKYDVVFTLSSVKYTNQPVTVQVKIPKAASFNSVTTTNSKSVSSSTVLNGYNVITVNETSEDKNGNYDINVTYTYGGVQKTVVYSVTNFDNTAPTISYTETENEGSRTINITNTDVGSGIKNVKYNLSTISDSTYFENYGKVLSGDKLVISSSDECTIYVQDNAGNSSMGVIPAK